VVQVTQRVCERCLFACVFMLWWAENNVRILS
jgi:hypothetical protein